ncbi:hypothetical protein HGRIS_012898 [Hohenbuehelia grisea]
MPPPLQRLPHEIMLHVGDNLDGKSLARWAMASRAAYDVIHGPHGSKHKYRIELAKAGMVDGGTGMPHSELLKRLLFYTTAWRDSASSIHELTLRNVGRHTVFMGDQMVPSGPSFCGVSGGYLYQVTGYTIELWQLFSHRNVGQVDVAPPPPRYAQFISQVPIQAIAIDPAQDLLVLLDFGLPELCFHFKQLSSFRPHPEAHNPDIMIEETSRRDLVVRQMEVCGNTIGVLFAPDERNCFKFKTRRPMHFAEWREGSVMDLLGVRIPWSFYFITEFIVLVTDYTRPKGEPEPRPFIWLFDTRPGGRVVPTRGTMLPFPWFGPAFRGRQPRKMSFVRNATSPMTTVYPAPAPFHYDLNKRLVGIKLSFGPHEAERPLGFPQETISIFRATTILSARPNDPTWFSQCIAFAPCPGTDLAFIGNKLFSAIRYAEHALIAIAVQELHDDVYSPQMFVPGTVSLQDRHKVSLNGKFMWSFSEKFGKAYVTEDNIVFLSDNETMFTPSVLKVTAVNY